MNDLGTIWLVKSHTLDAIMWNPEARVNEERAFLNYTGH